MRITWLAVAGMLVLAASPGVRAQQTSSDQDNQFGQRQTASTGWSSATAASPPEQAGDLYQGKGRSSDFGGATQPDSSVLPGALNPDTKTLDSGRQPDPRE